MILFLPCLDPTKDLLLVPISRGRSRTNVRWTLNVFCVWLWMYYFCLGTRREHASAACHTVTSFQPVTLSHRFNLPRCHIVSACHAVTSFQSVTVSHRFSLSRWHIILAVNAVRSFQPVTL